MPDEPRPRPTSELVGLLSSPDPALRDDLAYAQLAERISGGAEDGGLGALGDEAIGLLGGAEVYARTFGALLLAEVVGRDAEAREVSPATLRRWLGAFSRWYVGERDLRGWDDELGWLHAVAHGADVVAAFSRSPEVGRPDLTSLLEVARRRLLDSDGSRFSDQEDDRLAYAVALVLARPELTVDDRVGWLAPIRDALASGEPGPVPSWVTNTLHTLRCLYVLVHRGASAPPDGSEVLQVPEGARVTDAIADVLRLAFPLVG